MRHRRRERQLEAAPVRPPRVRLRVRLRIGDELGLAELLEQRRDQLRARRVMLDADEDAQVVTVASTRRATIGANVW